MGGGARTFFYGLIGILIALSASFVIYQRHQQRLREQRDQTSPQATSAHGSPPSRPLRSGHERR